MKCKIILYSLFLLCVTSRSTFNNESSVLEKQYSYFSRTFELNIHFSILCHQRSNCPFQHILRTFFCDFLCSIAYQNQLVFQFSRTNIPNDLNLCDKCCNQSLENTYHLFVSISLNFSSILLRTYLQSLWVKQYIDLCQLSASMS